jgi:hypothetical protein
MVIEERIKAFVQLGEYINTLPEEKFKTLAERIRVENPWFTEDSLRMTVRGLEAFLDEKKMKTWLGGYSFPTGPPKRVALIMAGNIPMVGFHDLLCVLLSGNVALIKLSSKDTVLIKWMVDRLIEIESRFSDKIIFADQLKSIDAVIATGSDNSARYFDYYFGKYPHIIRKNRTSVAILDGSENLQEMRALGTDVFTYFGLGCRNVSKLFVPAGYTFDTLFESWEPFQDIIHHHKYCNNYDYQKSILLVTQTPFLDNGFVMIQENDRLVSPIAVLYFEYYNSDHNLQEKLNSVADKLQCIVGKSALATVPFGDTQRPALGDYADGVDTLGFLEGVFK